MSSSKRYNYNIVLSTTGSLISNSNSNTVGAIITTGGNVGIGTISPLSLLHLSAGNTHNNILFESGTTSDGLNPGYSAINFNGYYNVNEQRINLNKNRWRINVDQRNTSDTMYIDTYNGTTLTSLMTLQTSGNVGIGTISPETLLHVNGAITLEGASVPGIAGVVDSGNLSNTYITFKPNGSDNDWAYLRQIGASNSYLMALDIHDDGDNPGFCIRSVTSTQQPDVINEIFRVQGNGNVGIGITSPTVPLEVNNVIQARGGGAGGRPYFAVDDATSAGWSFGMETDNSFRIKGGEGGGNNFRGGATDRLTITPSGNVGIGTSSPAFTLDVNGTAKITTSITTGALFSTNITSTNVVSTNVSSATLNLSTGLTSASAQVTNANITNATISSARINGPSGVGTNGSLLITGGDSYGHSLYVASLASQKRIGFNNTGSVGNIFSYDYGSLTPLNLALQGFGGNVGIGTSSPAFTLDVSGTLEGSNSNGVFLFASSGNVGIGTTNPETLLHVNGTITLEGANVSAASVLDITGTVVDSGSLSNTYITFKPNGSANDFAYLRQLGGNNNYLMALDIHDDGDEQGFCIRTVTSTQQPDVINERFRVQGNGNVGIGTSSPAFTLDVNGTLEGSNSNGVFLFASSGNVGIGTTTPSQVFSNSTMANVRLALLNGSNITGGTSRILIGGDNYHYSMIEGAHTTNGYTYLAFGTSSSAGAPTEKMRIDREGNVGIGTTSPSAKLHVITSDATNAGSVSFWDSTYAVFGKSSNTGGAVGIGFNAASGGSLSSLSPSVGWQVMRYRALDHRFIVAGDPTTPPSLTIASSGNVGIGTTAPGFKLDVNGTARITTSITTGALRANGSSSYTLSYGFLNSGGGTGFAVSQTSSYSVYAEDRIAATEFNAYSDIRIKKNIIDVNDETALITLRQIEPKKYNYIDTFTKTSTPVWGFIAQQVESVLDYSVNKITDYVPNIYSKADVVQNTGGSILTLQTGNTNVLDSTKSSDGKIKIKIYTINEELPVIETNVKTIINYTQLQIEENINEFVSEVFVYGQIVNDFNALNKDAIFTVSVAALQEVDRQLQTAKNDISDLQTRLERSRCDLIYKGTVTLVNGTAIVIIDNDPVTSLYTNPQYFLQNHSSFARVKGNISNNILTIQCEDNTSNDTIYWTVIA